MYNAAILAICKAIYLGAYPSIGKAAYNGLYAYNRAFALSLRDTSADPWLNDNNLGEFFNKVREYYSE